MPQVKKQYRVTLKDNSGKQVLSNETFVKSDAIDCNKYLISIYGKANVNFEYRLVSDWENVND